jgi:hypothetical protein
MISTTTHLQKRKHTYGFCLFPRLFKHAPSCALTQPPLQARGTSPAPFVYLGSVAPSSLSIMAAQGALRFPSYEHVIISCVVLFHACVYFPHLLCLMSRAYCVCMQMISDAIRADQNPMGSSMQAITRHVSDNRFAANNRRVPKSFKKTMHRWLLFSDGIQHASHP